MCCRPTITVACVIALLIPRVRNQEKYLGFIVVGVIAAIWIEKGVAMVVTGFIPNPLGHVTEYWPTLNEGLITLGIYAIGFLLLAGLYKIAISVREEIEVL